MTELRTPQRKALKVLLSGGHKKEAAEAADVTRRTVNRWIAEDKAFSDELRERTSANLSEAAHRLSGALSHAVSVFLSIAIDEDIAPQTRLTAANYIAKYAKEYYTDFELIDRVEKLEQLYKDRNNGFH